MYQLLYYSWKNYHISQNKFCDTKKNIFMNKEENKSLINTPSNNNTINIVVNNDLIKKIDSTIEYFENETITFLSCF